MKRIAIAAAFGVLLLAGPAFAQMQTTIPAGVMTMTNWSKQSVYDPANKKIGEIEDALVDPEGRILTLIVSVGGFLGMGEKDVAVPFTAVQSTMKDGKRYLRMAATKEALQAAPGFKFDRGSGTWRQ